MKPFLSVVAMCLGLVTLVPERAAAQRRSSVAVDAGFAIGHGTGGEFSDRDLVGARVAASVRRWVKPNTGAFAQVSMDWEVTSGHLTTCTLNSKNQCAPYFPEFIGPSAIVGVAQRLHRRIEARLGAGGAIYRPMYDGRGPQVGAAIGQFELAFLADAHIGLVAGTRLMVVPSYRHETIFSAPILLGIRARLF